ncbi:hypothetical protein [Aldersonia kunmingensis]|uniref:hypothetical protein n=1 Tax=Aldersonia kunmingensis TaxID=408066 RepID=UPI00082C673F|nr:hypothetical protein [Aldersonia kunmingensis]
MSLTIEHPAEVAPESHLLNSRYASRIGVIVFGSALAVFSGVLLTSVLVALVIGVAVTGLWCLTVSIL